MVQWTQFVDALCVRPLPLAITKTPLSHPADLSEILLSSPGSYILKPRFGSNGVCVVRIISHPTSHLTVESDCPDTSGYLEEYPCNPNLFGQDLVTAVATQRSRFLDRATADLPEWAWNQSVLEEEIRQDRASGSIFEPRIVVQRMKGALREQFLTLGAVCRRIDTSISASVIRGFHEEPLEASLQCFLQDRIPAGDLSYRVQKTRDEILAAGDQLRAKLVPLIETSGARIHQFGIDCRLCWNPTIGQVEYPFLEFQFGIGRIDPPVSGSALGGYKTRDELIRRFGPEIS
jgi:hypothetical protein